ncbi:MAG: tetratricopeptide repeat protein [Stenotrophomonas sp.]
MKPNSALRPLSAAMAASLLLAACSSAPPPAEALDTTTPAQRMAAVQAVAGGEETELSVQPLRDPQVDDLREVAAAKRAAGDLDGAAHALNEALLLVDNDPGILQERAEIALLQGDWVRAESLAKKAVDLGSRTGPLCRRHWATIEQSRLARVEKENAVSAHAQIEGCTVPGVKRY